MKWLYILLFIFYSRLCYSQISDFKNIDFTRANNTAKLHKGASLNNLPKLTYKLTSHLKTDVEKFRAIFSWICYNIKSDYNLHSKVSRKRNKYKNDSIAFYKWNKEYNITIFKRLRRDKETMCTGFAYLLREMSNLAGLECYIVDGYMRNATVNVYELENANHSWNAVLLNGKWYLADATLASGFMDGNLRFVQSYNDGYFLTDPELFFMNHFPFQKKWTLLSEDYNKEKFVSNPIIYSNMFRYRLKPIFPQKLYNTFKEKETFTYEYLELKHDKIQIDISKNSSQKKKKITDVTFSDEVVSFQLYFKKNRKEDIHIYINNDIIASYIAE